MNPQFLAVLSLIASGLPGQTCPAAVVYPQAPEGGRQMVSDSARGIIQMDPKFLGGLRFEDLTIADPFGDYYVDLKNLAAGKLLSAAKQGGWRYLLIHGTDAVGAVDLKADAKTGNALAFAGLYQTAGSNETLAALRMAEQLPPVQKQDYELRRLDNPGILFHAVWLHGQSDDIIIPLGDTFGRWNAGQPYSERQMIELLKPEAKKKLAAPGLID